MNVTLTPELEAWLREKVESGRYHSVDEAIREAVRLLELHDEIQAAKLKLLREEVAAGVDQLDDGQGIDGNQFLDDLEAGSK